MCQTAKHLPRLRILFSRNTSGNYYQKQTTELLVNQFDEALRQHATALSEQERSHESA